ncbi:MAG: recombinase family protein, partial [Planctomycetota bacterium]
GRRGGRRPEKLNGCERLPDFNKLQKAIFNGQVRTVVCWKLDRLSRSLRDGINLLADWWDRDVRVIAIAQQLDFSGPAGRMIAPILFALAEMERENLRENTLRGLVAARAKGKKLGRPRSVRGSSVARMMENGLSIPDIARRLDVSRPTVYTALKREGLDPNDYRVLKEKER